MQANSTCLLSIQLKVFLEPVSFVSLKWFLYFGCSLAFFHAAIFGVLSFLNLELLAGNMGIYSSTVVKMIFMN